MLIPDLDPHLSVRDTKRAPTAGPVLPLASSDGRGCEIFLSAVCDFQLAAALPAAATATKSLSPDPSKALMPRYL